MTDKKIELFENYPVHKALITLALPTILGMLVNVFYNMVDTFFVGQTGDRLLLYHYVCLYICFLWLLVIYLV